MGDESLVLRSFPEFEGVVQSDHCEQRVESQMGDREEQDWFEEWFDSPLYELIYSERNQGEAEKLANLIVELLPPSEFRHVLDLGCGRGRHSISLARRGYRVTGVDLSEASIRTARKRALEKGVKEVRFIRGDMREPFDETVDAVVNLFTSFGYFETDRENRQVLSNMFGMLRPGGRVVVDYLNSERVKSSFVPNEEGEYDGIHYSIRRYVQNQAIHKEIHFNGGEQAGGRSYNERVKLYDPEWFEEAFRSVGLQPMKLLGDYEGSSFDSESSPRLLVLAERPGSDRR